MVLAPIQAHAALNILACEPEWGALAKELGGDKASVYVATTALQDPHRVEARPSLIARARNADLMVCTGAQLEIGWAPLLQTQSGNSKIQTGQPGYFETASAVSLIEKPGSVDRSLGDVHPAGNPHLHLDPRNIAAVATALAERMASLDAPQAAYYRARQQ
ncbi:MAG: zinc ABC transporter substrate-binding protein, partial [Betaproteobacteria bacterium]